MNHRDIAVLMDGIAPVLRGYVEKAFEPIGARLLEIEKRFDALPSPRDGKDADPVLILRLVEETVAKIPPAPAGKDADPALVADLVNKAVAALEPAKDGEPGPAGASVTIEELTPLVMETVSKAVSAEVERVAASMPAGKDGSSVTIEDVVPVLQGMVDALPKAQDGKDADPADVAALIVEDVAKLIPKPEDGKSVTIEELIPLVQETVDKAVAAVPSAKDGAPGKDGIGLSGGVINRDGELVLMLSDGSTKAAGVVVGKDVDMADVARLINEAVATIPVPKDGRDGLGFEDMEVEYDGERTVTLNFSRGDVVKKVPLTFPVPIYRGVWQEGKYGRGDAVSFGGQVWIARSDTTDKPEYLAEGNAWGLSVKKGRDGKDFRPDEKRALAPVKLK